MRNRHSPPAQAAPYCRTPAWPLASSIVDPARAVLPSCVIIIGASCREAQRIIIDLRGNGGGNSAYADQLAAVIVGKPRLRAPADRSSGCSGSFWRVSATSIQSVRDARRRFASVGDERAEGDLAKLEAGLVKADESGDPFYPSLPRCATGTPPTVAATARTPSEGSPRLILITDHRCFSSCLIAVDLFRRLGALQVGETTDTSSRYMEVTEITLPSGLRTFSTLQRVALRAGDFGPYEPDIAFPGAMEDEGAVRAWVKALR